MFPWTSLLESGPHMSNTGQKSFVLSVNIELSAPVTVTNLAILFADDTLSFFCLNDECFHIHLWLFLCEFRGWRVCLRFVSVYLSWVHRVCSSKEVTEGKDSKRFWRIICHCLHFVLTPRKKKIVFKPWCGAWSQGLFTHESLSWAAGFSEVNLSRKTWQKSDGKQSYKSVIHADLREGKSIVWEFEAQISWDVSEVDLVWNELWVVHTIYKGTVWSNVFLLGDGSTFLLNLGWILATAIRCRGREVGDRKAWIRSPTSNLLAPMWPSVRKFAISSHLFF